MTKEEFNAKMAELEAEVQAAIEKGEDASAVEQKMKELQAEFKNVTASKIEAANKAAIENEAKAVPQSLVVTKEKEMEKVVDSVKLYESAFAAVLRGETMTAEEKEIFSVKNSTTTASSNTMLVPETVTNQIWDFIRAAHPIVEDANILHVPGEVVLPLDDGSIAAAAWSTESDATSAAALSMGSLTLKGNELSKVINVSWKLKKMAVPAFLSYVAEKLADLMGTAIADAFVNGKGQPGENDDWKPQPHGAAKSCEDETSTPQVVTYTAANGLAFTDITNALSKIAGKYSSGIVCYANQATIYTRLCNIKDGDSRPIFISAPADGAVARIFGIPVKVESAVADDAVLFGNMNKGYAANVNEEIGMTMEDHVTARNTDYGAYAILDGGCLNTKAFAYVKKSS